MTTNLPASSDETALRCPQCAALRAPGAQWCTQCYQRFTPEPPPAHEPPPSAATSAQPEQPGDTHVPRQSDAPAVELTSWDEKYRAVAAEPRDDAEVEQLMAQLSTPSASLGSASRLAKVTQSPGGKVLVVVAGGTLLLGTALMVMWVIGLLL